MSSGYRNCPFCGRLIASDAPFCRHCGADLGGAITHNNAESDYISSDDNLRFWEAFGYVFSDTNYALKIGCAAILILITVLGQLSYLGGQQPNIAVVITTFILFIASMLIFVGYNMSCIRRISRQSGTYNLPTMNFITNIITGLKAMIGYILFGIAVSFGGGIILGILGFLLGPISLVLTLLSFVLGLMFIICMYAFMWLFAQNEDIFILFKWGTMLEVLRNGWGRYFTALWFMFLSNLLLGLCTFAVILPLFFIIKVNILVIMLVYSVSGAYGFYLTAYWAAKCISPMRISDAS